MCAEIMIANPAIRALIREDKAHQIYSLIQTGGREGMCTMNASLYELWRTRQITMEEALSRSSEKDELLRLMNEPLAAGRRH